MVEFYSEFQNGGILFQNFILWISLDSYSALDKKRGQG